MLIFLFLSPGLLIAEAAVALHKAGIAQSALVVKGQRRSAAGTEGDIVFKIVEKYSVYKLRYGHCNGSAYGDCYRP